MPEPSSTLRRAAAVLAVVSTLPYLVLKVLWLSGSTIGVTSEEGLAELHSARYVAGNIVTVLLVLTAAAFVVVLSRSRAPRLPAGLVFVLGAGATGLLAPVVLGLPLGLGLEAALDGGAAPDHDTGLAPWVFGVVYTGFGLLGLTMAVLVLAHVRRRWDHLIALPPPLPSRAVTVAGAIGLLTFAAAMTYWGVAGVGGTGPQGMVSPAQRTVLAVTGLLGAAAYLAPHLSTARRRPRLAWLVLWTGCCVAALQGPAQLLLAEGGRFEPVVAGVAVISTAGACAYGLAVLHRARLRQAL
jgi:hypothetical protein